MLSKEEETHLAAAQNLYNQCVAAGFTYGCLEISLVTLGAPLTIDQVNRAKRHTSLLPDAIERNGLKLNWLVSTDQTVTPEAISALLEGEIDIRENYPDGNVVGYLWAESIPNQANHIMAILREQPNRYTVMDALVGSPLHLTADQLAYEANFVLNQGGSFEIVQIKKAFL